MRAFLGCCFAVTKPKVINDTDSHGGLAGGGTPAVPPAPTPEPAAQLDVWANLLNGHEVAPRGRRSSDPLGGVQTGSAVSLLDGADPVVLLEFAGVTTAEQPHSSPLTLDINLNGLLKHAGSCQASCGSDPAAAKLAEELRRSYAHYDAVRLSARFANGPLRSLLRCASPACYEALLSELLLSDPLLLAALKDSCVALMEGVAAADPTGATAAAGNSSAAGGGAAHPLIVQHPLPHTSSRALLPLTLRPLMIRRTVASASAPRHSGGHHHHHHQQSQSQPPPPTQLVAAVVLRYSLSDGVPAMHCQLARTLAALSGLPSSVSLLSGCGRTVLFQNTASIHYMGLRQGQGQGPQDGMRSVLEGYGTAGSAAGFALAAHGSYAGSGMGMAMTPTTTGNARFMIDADDVGDGGGGGGLLLGPRNGSTNDGGGGGGGGHYASSDAPRTATGAMNGSVTARNGVAGVMGMGSGGDGLGATMRMTTMTAATASVGGGGGDNAFTVGGGGVLRELFALSPQQLTAARRELAARRPWKGIVRVPHLLARPIAGHHAVAELMMGLGLGLGSGTATGGMGMGRESAVLTGSAVSAARGSINRVSGDDGALELAASSTWERLVPVTASSLPPPLSAGAAAAGGGSVRASAVAGAAAAAAGAHGGGGAPLDAEVVGIFHPALVSDQAVVGGKGAPRMRGPESPLSGFLECHPQFQHRSPFGGGGGHGTPAMPALPESDVFVAMRGLKGSTGVESLCTEPLTPGGGGGRPGSGGGHPRQCQQQQSRIVTIKGGGFVPVYDDNGSGGTGVSPWGPHAVADAFASAFDAAASATSVDGIAAAAGGGAPTVAAAAAGLAHWREHRAAGSRASVSNDGAHGLGGADGAAATATVAARRVIDVYASAPSRNGGGGGKTTYEMFLEASISGGGGGGGGGGSSGGGGGFASGGGAFASGSLYGVSATADGMSPHGGVAARGLSHYVRQSIELRRAALGLGKPARAGGSDVDPLSTSTWGLVAADGGVRGARSTLKSNTSFGSAVRRAGLSSQRTLGGGGESSATGMASFSHAAVNPNMVGTRSGTGLLPAPGSQARAREMLLSSQHSLLTTVSGITGIEGGGGGGGGSICASTVASVDGTPASVLRSALYTAAAVSGGVSTSFGNGGGGVASSAPIRVGGHFPASVMVAAAPAAVGPGAVKRTGGSGVGVGGGDGGGSVALQAGVTGNVAGTPAAAAMAAAAAAAATAAFVGKVPSVGSSNSTGCVRQVVVVGLDASPAPARAPGMGIFSTRALADAARAGGSGGGGSGGGDVFSTDMLLPVPAADIAGGAPPRSASSVRQQLLLGLQQQQQQPQELRLHSAHKTSSREYCYVDTVEADRTMGRASTQQSSNLAAGGLSSGGGGGGGASTSAAMASGGTNMFVATGSGGANMFVATASGGTAGAGSLADVAHIITLAQLPDDHRPTGSALPSRKTSALKALTLVSQMSGPGQLEASSPGGGGGGGSGGADGTKAGQGGGRPPLLPSLQLTPMSTPAPTPTHPNGGRGKHGRASEAMLLSPHGPYPSSGPVQHFPAAAAAVAAAIEPNLPHHGEHDDDDDDDDHGGGDGSCWHEVTIVPLSDTTAPATAAAAGGGGGGGGGDGSPMLLVMQTDVTARVRAERSIAEVLEAEHQLLESIFPRHVLELAAASARKKSSYDRKAGGAARYRLAQLPLAQDSASIATYHPMVTIMFADIKGFTNMCHEIPATKVMTFLNSLYSRLDTLLDVYGVYKVETIGDCYMVAGGLMSRDAEGFMNVRSSDTVDELHAYKAMAFAKAMLREAAQVRLPTTGQAVEMRIGLHSGPVMSGIVGSKMPRFCLFGDTVNTASRMESTCEPGTIHVSAATRAYLTDEEWEPTGGVQVKGIGNMSTFKWQDNGAGLLAAGGGAVDAAGKRAVPGTPGTRVRRASALVIPTSSSNVSSPTAAAMSNFNGTPTSGNAGGGGAGGSGCGGGGGGGVLRRGVSGLPGAQSAYSGGGLMGMSPRGGAGAVGGPGLTSAPFSGLQRNISIGSRGAAETGDSGGGGGGSDGIVTGTAWQAGSPKYAAAAAGTAASAAAPASLAAASSMQPLVAASCSRRRMPVKRSATVVSFPNNAAAATTTVATAAAASIRGGLAARAGVVEE